MKGLLWQKLSTMQWDDWAVYDDMYLRPPTRTRRSRTGEAGVEKRIKLPLPSDLREKLVLQQLRLVDGIATPSSHATAVKGEVQRDSPLPASSDVDESRGPAPLLSWTSRTTSSSMAGSSDRRFRSPLW